MDKDHLMDVYRFICEHKAKTRGVHPTKQEICDNCSISSKGLINSRLDRLMVMGLVEEYGAKHIWLVGEEYKPPQFNEIKT